MRRLARSIGKLTNSLRFDFNRSRTRTHNLYAFNNDITSTLGITGVSSNPFDWGLPGLSFTNFASLQDINPHGLVRNQTYTLSDYLGRNHGKHTWRWGGDFRFVQLNTEASSNARVLSIFTGANTSEIESVNGSPTSVPGTGYDFADFLLGLPQSTSVQFGQNNYDFRGHYWDLYAQDEWKARANFTLNAGVRYEYVSPFTELNNQIANLDLSPAVLNPALGTPAVAVVLPGQAGPYSGSLPVSLVRPDRNNFAPRIGFAWKPLPLTVVRGGYGINYNTGAYQTIAQKLAFQPPFSTAETNIQTTAGELTLQNGFPTPTPGEITNSYAVNPNYRLGYVQIRNLDIQQQIRPTLLLNLDYTGTKGTDLDILEAPNRTITPSGITILIHGVQAFTYENSVGDSEANAGSVRLRKRLSNGFSIGGIYTFSKSIDDASSIGAGATTGSGSAGLGAGGTGAAGGGPAASAGSGANTVAQNPLDISAERGLSSFNQTHKFTADYLWEPPFGQDKRWLTGRTVPRAIFGDWQWSGDWTIASGLPFTPRFVGNACEVNGGTNGTLRPNLVPGQSIRRSNPSIGEWFNTAAFVAPPTCAYGNSGRNSIVGPPTHVFDLAFTKIVPLKEARVLEARAQATNIFNIPNYASIDTSVTSPTFGRVTAVGAMRQIAMTAPFASEENRDDFHPDPIGEQILGGRAGDCSRCLLPPRAAGRRLHISRASRARVGQCDGPGQEWKSRARPKDEKTSRFSKTTNHRKSFLSMWRTSMLSPTRMWRKPTHCKLCRLSQQEPPLRLSPPIRPTNSKITASSFCSSISPAMEPDEIDRAVTSAEHYVDTQMAPADLVSIVSLGSSLLVNQDFTSDHDLLQKQLQAFGNGSGQGYEEGTTGTTEGTPGYRPTFYCRRYRVQHLQYRPPSGSLALRSRETFPRPTEEVIDLFLQRHGPNRNRKPI